jgi:hypothetical protein
MRCSVARAGSGTSSMVRAASRLVLTASSHSSIRLDVCAATGSAGAWSTGCSRAKPCSAIWNRVRRSSSASSSSAVARPGPVGRAVSRRRHQTSSTSASRSLLGTRSLTSLVARSKALPPRGALQDGRLRLASSSAASPASDASGASSRRTVLPEVPSASPTIERLSAWTPRSRTMAKHAARTKANREVSSTLGMSCVYRSAPTLLGVVTRTASEPAAGARDMTRTASEPAAGGPGSPGRGMTSGSRRRASRRPGGFGPR